MADVRVDVAAVRALAQRVLDGAGAVNGMHWATMDPDDMTGSSVSVAAVSPLLDERLADVVAHMRTWAATAQASATALDSADLRHVRRLDGGR